MHSKYNQKVPLVLAVNLKQGFCFGDVCLGPLPGAETLSPRTKGGVGCWRRQMSRAPLPGAPLRIGNCIYWLRTDNEFL